MDPATRSHGRTSARRSTAQPFARYFLNTMIIEVFVVTGTVLTCSVAAFSFSRLRWRGRNVVFGLLLSRRDAAVRGDC